MKLRQKQFIDTYIGIPLVYLNIFLARVSGFLLRRNHNIDIQPKEICFIKLLGFGSVVLASDAIYSVRRRYPHARLSIICSSSIEEGIRSLKLFDELYVINDDNVFRLLLSSVRIVFNLMQKSGLWTVDLEIYSKLTGILALWTMAVNRFGFYFNRVAFRYNLNTHNVFFNTVIQVEKNYIEMAKRLGVGSIVPFTIPGFPERSGGRQYHFIAVNNTCSELSPERKMSERQLIELCRWILGNTSYKIALLGAPSDKAYNDALIGVIDERDGRVTSLAGNVGFDDYYRFLYDECVMMLTIDSAPLHIANKLSIPNISIWGPTSPGSFVGLQTKNIQLYQQVACSPCVHFVDKLPCGGDNFCIKNIELGTITQSIRQILHPDNRSSSV